MKKFKNGTYVIALGLLSTIYSVSAMAVDATFWATASYGTTLDNAFIANQLFEGKATSARICGKLTAPCNIVVSLLVDYKSTSANCGGFVYVVTPDSVLGLGSSVLPDKINEAYPIGGPLNLKTGTGSGTITINGTTSNILIGASVDPLVIYHPAGTPAFESGVLRVDLTLLN